MDLARMRRILDTRNCDPVELFKMAEAYWVYRGLIDEPHAILTSGKHSDGYFNVNKVTQFSNLCGLFAGLLVQKLIDNFQEQMEWQV